MSGAREPEEVLELVRSRLGVGVLSSTSDSELEWVCDKKSVKREEWGLLCFTDIVRLDVSSFLGSPVLPGPTSNRRGIARC